MRPIHIVFDRGQGEARFSGAAMPRLEFRQALFRTPLPGWQRRLYPATLLVTTTAIGDDGRKLIVDNQSMRFSLLYNSTWPEPLFLHIRAWHYKPVELRKGLRVAEWTVEMRLRDLRLGPEEVVEIVVLG